MKPAVISIVAVIFGLLIAEGIVRVGRFAPSVHTSSMNYVSDPYLPYKPRPSSVERGRAASGEFEYEYQYNRFGFRDVEHTEEKPPGVFRIVGLGDSFTMGVGVPFPQSYLHRLETLLNQRIGDHPHVEIIKAGIPSYFPEPERLLLQHYGMRFSPDLVIVGFLPNDVADTHFGLDFHQLAFNGSLRSRPSMTLGTLAPYLFQISHLCRILLTQHLVSHINTHIRWNDVYVAEGSLEGAWQRAEKELSGIARIASQGSAKMLLLSIPQAGPWDETHSYVGSRLSSWCAKEGVTCVDTLPAFRASSDAIRLHYAKDGHCTREGYELVAKTAFDALTKSSLVP